MSGTAAVDAAVDTAGMAAAVDAVASAHWGVERKGLGCSYALFLRFSNQAAAQCDHDYLGEPK